MPMLRTTDILYEVAQLLAQSGQNFIFILDGV